MAYTVDWDQLSTLTREKIIPRIKDQYFKTNAMMFRLRPKAKYFSGGRTIVQPLSFAPEGGGGGWWAGTDKFDIRVRNPITAAQYYPKNFELPIVVTQDDEDENNGPEAVMSMVEAKMKIAQRTIMDSIGGANGLYNDGSNPKAITGLLYSLKTTAGSTTPPTLSYGGISRSSTLNTWWNPVTDGTAYATGSASTYIQAKNFGPWDNMFASQALNSGHMSTLVLCNWGVFNELRQIVQSKTTWFRPQQDNELAKAGFKTFQYMDKNVVVDEQVPRNATTKVESVFFLDEEALNLWIHTSRDFAFEGWRKPVDQAVRVAYIWFRGELAFDEMRSSGHQNNVDTTNTSP